MRKRIMALSMAMMLCMTVPFISFHAASLDDVVGQQTTTEQTQGNPNSQYQGSTNQSSNDQSSATTDPFNNPNSAANVQNQSQGNTGDSNLNLPKDSSAEEFANALSEGTNFTEETYQETTAVTNKIKAVVSPLIQIFLYLIMILMTIRVVIDLIYIVFPPVRAFLSNGHVGNAASQGTMQTGGFSGGYGGGMGSYGGFSGGMGGMNVANNMAMQQQNNPSNASRMQWVSQAALNAVASEAVVGPNGKANSPLKAYAKDMIVLMIGVPIMLILAASGILSKLGFALASVISGVIESIIASF